MSLLLLLSNIESVISSFLPSFYLGSKRRFRDHDEKRLYSCPPFDLLDIVIVGVSKYPYADPQTIMYFYSRTVSTVLGREGRLARTSINVNDLLPYLSTRTALFVFLRASSTTTDTLKSHPIFRNSICNSPPVLLV